MPEPAVSLPALVHHKTSNRACVRIAGRDIWLGKWGTPEAEEKYRRIVAEYIATGEPPVPPSTAPAIAPLTVTELIAKYRHFCEGYYRKNDQPTTELRVIRDSHRIVHELYGLTPAAEFGPLKIRGRWINLDQPPALLAAGVLGMAAPKVFKTAVGSTLLPISVTCKRPDGAVINRTWKPMKFYATDPDGNVVIEETEDGVDVIDAVAGTCQVDFQSSHIPRCS